MRPGKCRISQSDSEGAAVGFPVTPLSRGRVKIPPGKMAAIFPSSSALSYFARLLRTRPELFQTRLLGRVRLPYPAIDAWRDRDKTARYRGAFRPPALARSLPLSSPLTIGEFGDELENLSTKIRSKPHGLPSHLVDITLPFWDGYEDFFSPDKAILPHQFMIMIAPMVTRWFRTCSSHLNP